MDRLRLFASVLFALILSACETSERELNAGDLSGLGAGNLAALLACMENEESEEALAECNTLMAALAMGAALGIQANTCPAHDLPALPHPIPSPTSIAPVDIEDLLNNTEQPGTVGDVATVLKQRMQDIGFEAPTFLGYRCAGFAIVSGLEEFGDGGERLRLVQRDEVNLTEERFDILAYLRGLVYSPPGYYRTILIVASPEDLTIPDIQGAVNADLVAGLAQSGTDTMDGDKFPFPIENYTFYAAVYELEKRTDSETFDIVEPAGLIATRTHLIGTGLLVE